MKRGLPSILIASWFTLAGAASAAETTTLSTSSTVMVWVKARDARIGQGVEIELRSQLADRRIATERFSKVFPQAPQADAKQAVRYLAEKSVTHVLVLKALPAEAWTVEESTPALASEGVSALESYFAANASAVRPETIEPVKTPERPSGVGTAPMRGPIPVHQGPEGQRVAQVGAEVFEVATGAQVWSGKFPVRAPQSLPTERLQKKIAEETAKALEKAGVLPKLRS